MAEQLQDSFDTILESSPPSIREIIAVRNGLEEMPFNLEGVIDATAETEVAKLLGYHFSEMSKADQDSVRKVVKYLHRNKLIGKHSSEASALRKIEFKTGKPSLGQSRLAKILSYTQLRDKLIGILKHVEGLKTDALRDLDG